MSIQIDPSVKAQLREEFQKPINQARMQVAAWSLGVAGAQMLINKQRQKLVECVEDVAALRKRMDSVAEQQSEPQQKCLMKLDGALTEYGKSAERSDACLTLLEEYLAVFERQLGEHTQKLDKVTAVIQSKRPKASRKASDIGSQSASKRQ